MCVTSSTKTTMISAGCAAEQPMITSSGFWESSPDESSESNGSQFLYVTRNCVRNIWKAFCLSTWNLRQEIIRCCKTKFNVDYWRVYEIISRCVVLEDTWMHLTILSSHKHINEKQKSGCSKRITMYYLQLYGDFNW